MPLPFALLISGAVGYIAGHVMGMPDALIVAVPFGIFMGLVAE